MKQASCYYHVVEGSNYSVYEYWYYYSFNDYPFLPPVTGGILNRILDFLGRKVTPRLAEDHEHDFEFAYVYVSKDTGKVEHLVLNQHFWQNYYPVKGEMPEIKVELGGHGIFVEKKEGVYVDRWEEGGPSMRVSPFADIEELRREFITREPSDLIDKKSRLIGDNYDFLRIGSMWGPEVPWMREHYYLPEATIFGRPRKIEPTALLKAMLRKEVLPLMEKIGPISIPYVYDNPRENIKLGVKLGLIKPKEYDKLKRMRLR